MSMIFPSRKLQLFICINLCSWRSGRKSEEREKVLISCKNDEEKKDSIGANGKTKVGQPLDSMQLATEVLDRFHINRDS